MSWHELGNTMMLMIESRVCPTKSHQAHFQKVVPRSRIEFQIWRDVWDDAGDEVFSLMEWNENRMDNVNKCEHGECLRYMQKDITDTSCSSSRWCGVVENTLRVPWIILLVVNVIVYVKTRCVISVRIGCWNKKNGGRTYWKNER